MPRLILVVAILFSPLFVLAAPVPKHKAKNFENFGTAVETKGVTCEMTQPGELRVSLSKEATTKSNRHFEARPLVAQTVEGDFELTVRVTHAPPDGKDLTVVGRGDPIASAGIALTSSICLWIQSRSRPAGTLTFPPMRTLGISPFRIRSYVLVRPIPMISLTSAGR